MSKRTLALTAVGAGVVAIVAIVAVTTGNGASLPTRTSELQFSTVQRRDLAEVTTLAGTLGFPEGESVPSRLRGTITEVAASGDVVAEGELLFAVDGEPVTLLLGSIPAFRAIGQTPIEGTATAGVSGVVTSVVAEGTVLESGGEIARVNDHPLMLLPGSLPVWRSLRAGSEGPDVRQLEAALVGLGFDTNATVTVDDYFSSATTAMVERWQQAVGAEVDGDFDIGDGVFFPGSVLVTRVNAAVGAAVGPSAAVVTLQTGSTPIDGDDVLQLQQALVRLGYEAPTSGTFDETTRAAVEAWQRAVGAAVDGSIDLGEVVFLPAPVRVTEAILGVGRPVNDGSAVLATTGSTSVVMVNLPANDQSLLTVDQRVAVVMPDGTEVEATVTAISGIATRLGGGEVVFETTIIPIDATVGAALDQAPVDVLVTTDSRTSVLAVPVTALLALAEGGYAVEVDAGDGTTRLVAVEPGLYADSWVEVTGDGLAAGDRVVVP